MWPTFQRSFGDTALDLRHDLGKDRVMSEHLKTEDDYKLEHEGNADDNDDDDILDRMMRNLRNDQIRPQRAGFNSGASVLVWTAFWDLANRNQDNPRFVILSWVCVGASIWAASYL